VRVRSDGGVTRVPVEQGAEDGAIGMALPL